MSTQPCGCDPTWVGYQYYPGKRTITTEGWLCQRHRGVALTTEKHGRESMNEEVALLEADRRYGFGDATDAKSKAAIRKEYPLATGCLDYFALALMEVAHISFIGNQQHHPGQPLHWDRSKSTDEADACMRHFKDRGTRDTDGTRHTAKAAWRILALLQKELEEEQK